MGYAKLETFSISNIKNLLNSRQNFDQHMEEKGK